MISCNKNTQREKLSEVLCNYPITKQVLNSVEFFFKIRNQIFGVHLITISIIGRTALLDYIGNFNLGASVQFLLLVLIYCGRVGMCREIKGANT